MFHLLVDVCKVLKLFAKGKRRLVTITGAPAGLGKTELAKAVGMFVTEHNNSTNNVPVFHDYKDGVAFVNLSPGDIFDRQLLSARVVAESKRL